MKMERKFKFGLLAHSKLVSDLTNQAMAVFACLKREAKFQNFKRSQFSSKST